jgi:gamma-glutamyltranspeptidase/glutathione hydrolase
VRCSYRGYDIVSAPPPSSGGTTICEILNIASGFPLDGEDYHSAASTHNLVEAMRRAYVDRNNRLGDPAFVANPLAQLLSADYAAKLRATIEPDHATPSDSLKSGLDQEGNQTTHYSVIDAAGNAVGVTFTINSYFGAKVIAGKTGFFLNDEMDDFTAKPGSPNMFGLVQGSANAIAPGKRPLSSMTPTIVSRDGKPVLVIGASGGSRIITVVTHCILNVIDYGMNIQDAIDTPRFHQQWLPDTTGVEEGALKDDARRALVGMGQKLTDSHSAGRAVGILVGGPSLGIAPHGNERFYGAVDSRMETGLAAGF